MEVVALMLRGAMTTLSEEEQAEIRALADKFINTARANGVAGQVALALAGIELAQQENKT